MQSVSIFGVGRIGGSLAIALSRAGYQVNNLIYRSVSTAESVADLISPMPKLSRFQTKSAEKSDILLICTRDPDIEYVSRELSVELKYRPVVLHTSGSLSSDVLSDLANIGCETGSMHPLVSISDPVRGAESYNEAHFCVEGDTVALSTAQLMVIALGGKPFSIRSEFKPLYHAAAVTACGHLTALFDAALEMLASCGIEGEDARHILLPLLESTVENLKMQTTEDALTGSFARADAEAFKRHWKMLNANVTPLAKRIFLELGERSLEISERKGIDPDSLERVRELIKMAKHES